MVRCFSHRLVVAANVWLTALMVLVGGFPRLACACASPNERGTPGDATLVASAKCGCECCCQNSSGGTRKAACCRSCSTARSDHGQTSANGACVKRLATSQLPLANKGAAKVSLESPALLCILLPNSLTCGAATAPAGPDRNAPPRVPPPDLVTLLQHFLI